MPNHPTIPKGSYVYSIRTSNPLHDPDGVEFSSTRRVGVDFPEWMGVELDRAAQKLGITRQSLIKVFISEKLKDNAI